MANGVLHGGIQPDWRSHPGAANLIAGNSSVGIYVYDLTATNNSIRGNSMFNNGNGNLAIYLSTGGNTPAVPPSLTSATAGVTNTTVNGSLTSLPSTVFHLDFYASPAPSSTAQGRDYLGALDVTTSGGGSVAFSFTNAPAVLVGQIIRATATDPAGNTSGLSGAVTNVGPDSVGDGIPNAWRAAFFGWQRHDHEQHQLRDVRRGPRRHEQSRGIFGRNESDQCVERLAAGRAVGANTINDAKFNISSTQAPTQTPSITPSLSISSTQAPTVTPSLSISVTPSLSISATPSLQYQQPKRQQ